MSNAVRFAAVSTRESLAAATAMGPYPQHIDSSERCAAGDFRDDLGNPVAHSVHHHAQRLGA
jgi:hypothetical protein